MKTIKLTYLAIPAFLLMGCMPPLTQQQCTSMNWKAIGLNDGFGGHGRDLNRYISECSQFGVHVSVEQYQQGYNQGLHQYCTYERGLSIGSQGNGNPGVCPATAAFNRGFQQGADQFCQNPDRGFQLGSQGAGYPDACSPIAYPAFSHQYARGRAIYERASNLQETSQNINDRIEHLVHKYHLRERTDGSYTLGSRDNPEARNALQQVQEMAKRRDHLDDKLFKAQTMY